MHARHVIALQVVVDVDLPVAADVVAHVQPVAVAGQRMGGAEARVDAGHQRIERAGALVECGKDQALPLRDAGLRERDRADVEVLRAAHLGGAAKPAVERVAPAVVLADQFECATCRAGCARLQRARGFAGQRTGAMAAYVVQRAQHAVVAAGQQQRHGADLGSQRAAGLRDLRGMADQMPAAREHALAVERGEVRLDIAGRGQRTRGGLRLRVQQRGIEPVVGGGVDRGIDRAGAARPPGRGACGCFSICGRVVVAFHGADTSGPVRRVAHSYNRRPELPQDTSR